VIGSVVVPNLQATRVRANDDAAAAVMQAIRSAQETFRSNALRDADGDGEGEFGLLVDLVGDIRPGLRRPLSGRRLLTVPFKKTPAGDYTHSGYVFRIYLPAEDGSPVGGNEKEQRVKQIDGDLAEAIMVTVAWPVEKTTGSRAFILDSAGGIHWCDGAGYYGFGEHALPPDLLCTQPGNLASEQIRPGQQARDGRVWRRIR
jgi:hypothetical protein